MRWLSPLGAILAVTIALAGCGSSPRPRNGILPGVTKIAATQRIQKLEHELTLGSPEAQGVRATRPPHPAATRDAGPPARAVALHVSLPRPRRPYAAGPLTATYRVTLRGGDALTPPGPYPRASGNVVLRIYGHTETCWNFGYLRAIKGPRLAGIALGADGSRGIISMFTTTFARHGCQTGIPASTLMSVERHPTQFSVVVEDHNYFPSLVGTL
jgi:hypothetical protein